MAAPVITSYLTHTSAVTTNVVDLSTVADGSWMVAVLEIGTSSVTITPPAGWTTLLPIANTQTFGSRTFGLWGRIKQSGDASFTWTISSANTNRLSVIWGTGGDIVTNWHIGNVGVRGAGNVVAGQSIQAGTSTTSVAPAVTTSVNNSLVLALNMEATTATETAPSSYTGGTELFWSGTDSSYIESLHVLYNTQATPGAVGDVTTTYPNAQTSNGAGVQLIITPSGVTYNTPSVTGTVTETVFNLSGTGALTYSITMPTGIVVNDYLMAFVRVQSSNVVAHPSLNGFTLVGRTQTLSSSNNRYNAIFAKKILSSGDIPNSTELLTLNQSVSGSNRALAEVFRISNVDLTNPIVGIATIGTSVSSTLTRPAYASAVGALDIFYAASEFATPNDHIPTALPAGYTSIISGGAMNPIGGTTANSRTYMYIGTRTDTSSTAAAASISWNVTAGADVEGISIRGKSAPVPAGIALKNGAGNPIYLTYLDNTLTRKVPYKVRQWLPGYSSVNALLGDISRHPTMAHRGGSSNYPEFSEYGYDHAVTSGFGVLEFSCGWTSDLIPFGLASQYLDTAAGLSAGTNLDPTTISWATLSSTYQNKLTPVAAGVYQPFYRLADFLAKYTPTHVVCVDPKFGFATTAKVNAMLDLCDAYGGPSRIIIKFDSPTTNTVMTNAAHARGYKCMNYWGTDLTSLTAQHSNWDILGYSYSAPSSDWASILALGKPTWAAIIPDTAGIATAVASGAGLMMVRNVLTIPPVSVWNS